MAKEKKLTPEQEKEIKILQASNEMMERTKAEAKAKGASDKTIEMINNAQRDVIAQMNMVSGEIAQKTLENNKKNNDDLNRKADFIFNNYDDNNAIISVSNEKSDTETKIIEDTTTNDIDPTAQYDVISLPSNGEGYKNKISRVPVAYLTAYDENFITSPNLYKDGLVIDFLLKHKIMNKNINIDELYRGDVDAIILFLRVTSYGPDFPVSVRDPQTGKQIETNVDLSKLKTKEFKLKGDSDGYFDFELPLSKDNVKFKFLSRKEEKLLSKLTDIEDTATLGTTLSRVYDDIDVALKKDKLLTKDERLEMTKYLAKLNEWAKKVADEKIAPYNKTITNRLEMEIVSINGNDDRKYIHDYVKNMRAKDSLMLRRYINDNEPGIDFEVTIERPEEFGGGSFTTFLEWDDFVFINIS